MTTVQAVLSGIAPGPKRKYPGSHLLNFYRDPLGFLRRIADEYGDVVRLKIGPQEFFLLNRPEYIRDVLVTNHHMFVKGRALQKAKKLLGDGLVTSEGDFHNRQRKLAQPAFHQRRIAGYAQTMVECANHITDEWVPGQVVDIAPEMMRLTLGIVSKTLFSCDVESEARDIGDAVTVVIRNFLLAQLPFAEYFEALPLPAMRRLREAKQFLDATIYRLIQERRREGGDCGDLLSMLLLSQEENGSGGMTDQQVRDEAITIFLAGHETTATALAWTWHLLSKHPEVEVRLHQEIDETLKGASPSAQDYPKLRYVEMVLAESMRLFPPVWCIGRRAPAEYSIGRYVAPSNSIFLMSQYVMHRDARYFRDPERFDPERWTPEEKSARPKFSYFPFGGGPRMCIGDGFAWMEGVLLIAAIARRWRFRPTAERVVEPEPLVTLRPKGGLPMLLERRESVFEGSDSMKFSNKK